MNRATLIVLAAFVSANAGCEYQSHSATEPVPDGGLLGHDAGEGSRGTGGSDGPRFAQHHEPAVQATVAAWRERHFIHRDVSSPDSARCIDEIGRLETVVVSTSEFRRLCSHCEPGDDSFGCDELGRANACAPIGQLRGEDGELGEPQPLNVIAAVHAEGTDVYQRLVIHETVHHLGRCSGYGVDYDHDLDHLWCSRGQDCFDEDEGSITERARTLLAHHDDDR